VRRAQLAFCANFGAKSTFDPCANFEYPGPVAAPNRFWYSKSILGTVNRFLFCTHTFFHHITMDYLTTIAVQHARVAAITLHTLQAISQFVVLLDDIYYVYVQFWSGLCFG
jgi:hypothetical protein